MASFTLTRPVKMPDVVRISRYERVPELGPKVLFFSGGSALNDLSRALKSFTHNSVHLVTPFDSGGSSAVLRDAFQMPAIGDLRSRLMALADETIRGNPEVFQLFAHRFPKEGTQADLRQRLKTMAAGKDSMISAIKNPMRRLIQTHLSMMATALPETFDLRGASIGNLILTAGYLNNNKQLEPVIFLFSRLVNVLGHVSPIIDDVQHLAAELEDGSLVVGQHRMTGKEVDPLSQPIRRIFLVESLEDPTPVHAQLHKSKRKLIRDAELICYPPGSFYSSLTANLLPVGVGTAIAANACPKIYVPSLGGDPELLGRTVDDSIFLLLEYLLADSNKATEAVSKQARGGGQVRDPMQARDFLSFVLIDSKNGVSLKRGTRSKLKKLGIDVIDTRVISPKTAPYYDPRLLAAVLLSLT